MRKALSGGLIALTMITAAPAVAQASVPQGPSAIKPRPAVTRDKAWDCFKGALWFADHHQYYGSEYWSKVTSEFDQCMDPFKPTKYPNA